MALKVQSFFESDSTPAPFERAYSSCNHSLNGNKGHHPGQLIRAFVHTGWHITTL